MRDDVGKNPSRGNGTGVAKTSLLKPTLRSLQIPRGLRQGSAIRDEAKSQEWLRRCLDYCKGHRPFVERVCE